VNVNKCHNTKPCDRNKAKSIEVYKRLLIAEKKESNRDKRMIKQDNKRNHPKCI